VTKRGQLIGQMLMVAYHEAPKTGPGSAKARDAFLKRAIELIEYELDEALEVDLEQEELRSVAIALHEAVKLAHLHAGDNRDLKMSLEFALRRAEEVRLP
jgi:hypothetical protein